MPVTRLGAHWLHSDPPRDAGQSRRAFLIERDVTSSQPIEARLLSVLRNVLRRICSQIEVNFDTPKPKFGLESKPNIEMDLEMFSFG
jgi:hypothetical protein